MAKLGLKKSDLSKTITFETPPRKIMRAGLTPNQTRSDMNMRRMDERDDNGNHNTENTAQTIDDLRTQVMAISDPKERTQVALNMLGLEINNL